MEVSLVLHGNAQMPGRAAAGPGNVRRWEILWRPGRVRLCRAAMLDLLALIFEVGRATHFSTG